MNNITPKKARAIKYLLTCNSIKEVAVAVSISERTLFRWMGEPAFRTALFQAEASAIDSTIRRLIKMQTTSLNVLEEMMQSNNVPPSVRVRAALGALNIGIKLRELRDIEDRLLRIERLLYEFDFAKTD